ncbi:rom-4 [Pristionchus pacificus]|uniref:Rom-3 n=1 Tax=Pristionchus pacificus TaxID=54126 RepID=A0A2A6BR98_PRIPA|nr:rom-4 [Pristionchus pacificus]|eukprot:PDM68425.1 rom-3 [Pristionchus pacificus]
MLKTPASAGGPRRVETIELSEVPTGPSRKLEKSTSVPLQQRMKTPISDQQRTVFELGAPPSRNPFQRGNTIREAVGEFVGLSETPAEPSGEGGTGRGSGTWSDRRLQYFNRKFKLSKDFVQSCDERSSGGLHRQQHAASLSPVVSQYQAPPTPGLASFHIVVDPQAEARARSVSIESRPRRRDSAFKIITENCASLITKGRLTPTAAQSSRIRRNNATASFTVAESPLASSSLTPGPYAFSPQPLHRELNGADQDEAMSMVPLREPPSAERRGDTSGSALSSASASGPPARTRKREVRRFRRLHRLLEADEHAAMAEYEEADERERMRGKEKEEEGEDGGAEGGSRDEVEWQAASTTVDVEPSETGSQSLQNRHQAVPSTRNQSGPSSILGMLGSGQCPMAVVRETAHTMISAPASAAGGRPATAAHASSSDALPPLSASATASPPFLVSRPTMLPMGGDETTQQSIATDELFFDITPPKRAPKTHATLPTALFAAPQRGLIALGGGGRVMDIDRRTDRAEVTTKEKKVKFMEIPLVDTLKRQMEAKWHEQKTYRTGGVGAFGECLGRKTKQLEELPEALKKRIKMTVNERPFFTFWVTFTQLLVCLASVAIFGFGAFSPSFAKKDGEVPSLDRTLITVGVYEKGNIWLGPKFADLIRLGAKYSPCMRAEHKIMSRIEQDRIAESYTGCCIHTDGFCYQAGDQCPRTLATLHLYRGLRRDSPTGLRRTQSSPELRQASLSTAKRSQIVCGLDPDFCAVPSLHSFSGEDITKWPTCEREIADSELGRGFRPRHLTCTVMGRPCCIHLQGRCRITTKEYCAFVGGTLHEEASLCSQVNCLHGICGMIPFGDSPNQIYRLFTSIFLHAGLLHLAITIFFQMVFMRDLENYIGWKRMAFIYFISGMGGNLASAIFVPFNPEVGPSGALAGIVTTLFVDVFVNRDMLQQPLLAIAQNGGWLAALFMIGLLPWVDNWAILFGTVFGLLATFVFLPDVGLRRGAVFRRFIVIFGAITLLLLFALLFYIFIENIDIDCTWCGYFNCFNWYQFFAYDPDDGNHFCDNQGLQVNSWLPI